jgi:hypothetical protein
VTEAEEQAEVIEWFRRTYPQHVYGIRVSLNGLNLGSPKRAAILINHAVKQGMVKGESDLYFAIPKGGYGGLAIEHKAAGSAHTTTQEQIDYIEYHNEAGNMGVITRGVEALKSAIAAYMEM